MKPLAVIWGKYPTVYTAKNTIMFDDIRRNFLMNPQNGLRIRAFREAHLNRDKDRELLHLAKYLKDIAALEDLSQLNHRSWEKYRPSRKWAFFLVEDVSWNMPRACIHCFELSLTQGPSDYVLSACAELESVLIDLGQATDAMQNTHWDYYDELSPMRFFIYTESLSAGVIIEDT